jgi:hypothetical protein
VGAGPHWEQPRAAQAARGAGHTRRPPPPLGPPGPRALPRPRAPNTHPQICVQGIPWKYTWQDLKGLFEPVGEVERADVMQAPDGRSKARGGRAGVGGGGVGAGGRAAAAALQAGRGRADCAHLRVRSARAPLRRLSPPFPPGLGHRALHDQGVRLGRD